MPKKTILITGAGGHLGKITVSRFLKEGWRVIASVSPGKSLSGFEGNDVHVYAIDLRDEQAVAGLIQSLFSEFGQLHAALLLAGGFTTGSIADTQAADLRKMITLNFETAYHIARPIVQHMKHHQTGRIVFIGAKPSLETTAAGNKLAYALSKAMLVKLSAYINAEGNSHNLASYCLVPDIIDTPDNRMAMPKADFSKWIKPEKMAEVMSRLCDEKIILTETIIKLY
jgi:NAD(P)-dependent dehydrogenase (short-subunit alcohol dehydrogenase family)